MSRSSHLIAWGGLLLFIFLFFDWQQVCVNIGGVSGCGGRSGWHGWGVLVGILTIVLVAWEAMQIFAVKLELPFRAALLTTGLAAGVLLFTVIKFLVDNEARHWPAWIGLILAIVIAVGGYLRYAGDEVNEINVSKAPPAAPPPPAEPPAA
ncbi:MAG TPA: hypothetical protein VH816_04735 [Gaiellaceae bacterium]